MFAVFLFTDSLKIAKVCPTPPLIAEEVVCIGEESWTFVYLRQKV